MQLTSYTDYSLRVLMYLGQRQEQATLREIAEFYQISLNHLVKVGHGLAKLGLVKTTQGRGGGIRLAVDPKKTTVGEIVRRVEPHLHLVECFNAHTNTCPVAGLCRLSGVLREAQRAFLDSLESHTLDELILGSLPQASLPK